MHALPPPGDDNSPLVNLELEQGILGTLLDDATLVLWPQVIGTLKPEHFSEPLHSRIYERVAKSAGAGIPPSLVTLKTVFAQDDALNEVGGMGYLARLLACAVIPMQFRHNIETLQDLSARRAFAVASTDMVKAASTITDEPFRLTIAKHIEEMQTLFDHGSTRRTTFNAGDAATSMLDRIERVRKGEVDPNAIKTGIASIDRQTGGLHRGEFIVLGARPSVGKSALATQIAYNVAKRGQGVAYFSLEMTEEQLISRLVSSVLWSPQGSTNVSYERIRHANLNDMEMRWVANVAQEFSNYPLIIDTKEGLAPAELEARANVIKARMAREYGCTLDLVIVDHMHRMQQPGTRSDVEKYSEISARLAEMAKRLNCPMLTLAQLNRGLEGREDKRPQLSDLRASGSIEQDADVALFVHRPAYHLSRQKHLDPMKDLDRLTDLAASENVFEVIVEKQRNGPTGTIPLWCDMANNVICDREEAMASGVEVLA